jgi:hypothetical protein
VNNPDPVSVFTESKTESDPKPAPRLKCLDHGVLVIETLKEVDKINEGSEEMLGNIVEAQ